jgi:hypothetical protein
MFCGYFLLPLRHGGSQEVSSIVDVYNRYGEKTIHVYPRYLFDACDHMIRSVPMNSCLTVQKRFLLFKGPGYLTFFLSAEYFKARGCELDWYYTISLRFRISVIRGVGNSA